MIFLGLVVAKNIKGDYDEVITPYYSILERLKIAERFYWMSDRFGYNAGYRIEHMTIFLIFSFDLFIVSVAIGLIITMANFVKFVLNFCAVVGKNFVVGISGLYRNLQKN